MASVKCEYCGNYIADSQEKCPTCGATNKDFKRMTDGTPRTIEQLQSWYRARNLPPEEVTRFFIGKNIKEPRAFGIYEENGRFIVYKNKSDGSRAIRYEGKDEAYAVNELYLRLKEEILNQKNINSRKRSSNSSRAQHSSISYTSPSGRRRKRRNFGLVFLWPILLVFFSNFAIWGLIGALLGGDYGPSNDYYATSAQNIYYLEGYDSEVDGYLWWKYDDSSQEWRIFETYEEDELPPGLTEDNKYEYLYDLVDAFNLDSEKIDIRNSKAFIDAGNHETPSTSYYMYNNNLYYYLDDSHSSYGSSNNSGWYIYEDDDWKYYCSEDDKSALGDDLWYNDSDYYIGRNYTDIYDYNEIYGQNWNPTDFEDTTWYQSYESNEAAYDRHLEEQRNDDDDYDWSNDDDWDWDSGDSWDSGGADWDSDW